MSWMKTKLTVGLLLREIQGYGLNVVFFILKLWIQIRTTSLLFLLSSKFNFYWVLSKSKVLLWSVTEKLLLNIFVFKNCGS